MGIFKNIKARHDTDVPEWLKDKQSEDDEDGC